VPADLPCGLARLYRRFTFAAMPRVNRVVKAGVEGHERKPCALEINLTSMIRLTRFVALAAIATALSGCIVLPFGHGQRDRGGHRHFDQAPSDSGRSAPPGHESGRRGR